ncbi:MAG: hypothetical protein PHQ62_01025 [Clostridia bacterium]|nr:hypothetical protein [Clostridia bacterium]
MRQASIKNSKLNMIDFIEENILGLRGQKIFFSSSLFDELWKKCKDENGDIKTYDVNRIKGLLVYSFSYPAPENNKSKGDTVVKIVDCGYNEKMKRFLILEIKSNQFFYKKPNPILSQNIYLNNNELKKESTRQL